MLVRIKVSLYVIVAISVTFAKHLTNNIKHVFSCCTREKQVIGIHFVFYGNDSDIFL